VLHNGSVTISGVTLIVRSSGVAPNGGPGTGGVPAAFGTLTPIQGASGEARLTTLGGLTLTEIKPV
jgi:hypothetical protein